MYFDRPPRFYRPRTLSRSGVCQFLLALAAFISALATLIHVLK
jgi:hypothetical protein